MQTQEISTPPLACVPGAIPAGERAAHFARVRRLFDEVAESRERLAEGYAFRFPADALDEVARFVSNERRCCPFLTFALEVTPGEGPLWLRLTGPEGSPDFIEAELLHR